MAGSEPKRKARIKLEYNIEYPNPIQVAAGDKVSVGREDDEYPGWRWCQAADRRAGWIPASCVLSDLTRRAGASRR
jgi:hypothetical protein